MIRESTCGPEETRTPDLLHAMEALYQLSYRPESYLPIIPISGHSSMRWNIERCHGGENPLY
jgi:hypothetical protein